MYNDLQDDTNPRLIYIMCILTCVPGAWQSMWQQAAREVWDFFLSSVPFGGFGGLGGAIRRKGRLAPLCCSGPSYAHTAADTAAVYTCISYCDMNMLYGAGWVLRLLRLYTGARGMWGHAPDCALSPYFTAAWANPNRCRHRYTCISCCDININTLRSMTRVGCPGLT